MKWIAPSAMTMKCVFQITKITVCDVFVSLDIYTGTPCSKLHKKYGYVINGL